MAARAAPVCLRARWVEEGETSSAYFFRLEKKSRADRWISTIKQDDGTVISPAGLCAAFVDFYTSLFLATPTDPDIQASLLSKVSSS